MHRDVDVEQFCRTECAHDSIRMCRDIYQDNVADKCDA
jgi:hypothetical protein